jgi:NADPH-dependent curcumin reductase CurA
MLRQTKRGMRVRVPLRPRYLALECTVDPSPLGLYTSRRQPRGQEHMPTNRQVKLAQRPVGLPQRTDFTLADGPVPEPKDGEILVKSRYVSLDPAMRGWMSDARSYVPPVALGAVMRGYAAGHVETSRHPQFKAGDAVVGVLGVQQYAVAKGEHVDKVDTSAAPLSHWLGGLGMTGRTAYFGLIDVLQPKPGETVVVSAASGAVGSIVGQIAKIKGCRTVGIAGGGAKCKAVVEELGFDACVDYKSGRLAENLHAACPDGVDAYFENVGGDILDTMLLQMRPFGRICVCGLISSYSDTGPTPGPRNMRAILTQRLKMQGMIVSDWKNRFPEAREALLAWYRDGKLKLREDIRTGGLDAFPETLNLLYTGGNNGKLLLEV